MKCGCWDFGATSYDVAANVHVVITSCFIVNVYIRDGNEYQNDIRIFVLRYSNIFEYSFYHLSKKLSYLSFLTLLSGYCTIRNIVLFIIVAATTFEHLPRAIRVIRISEPKNGAKIRNIYI